MTDTNKKDKAQKWHRDDNYCDDVNFSILLYTLKEDNSWRKGQPAMVNDMMIRIENANGSNNDIAAVANTILAALNAPSAPAEVEGLVERHQDNMRNIIINRTSCDLEQIINGHDPDIDNLGNRVWDRLDMMACEIEARHATTLFVLQARAEKSEAERVAWKEMAKELAEAGCAIDVLHGSFGKARLSWQKALAAYAKLKGEA